MLNSNSFVSIDIETSGLSPEKGGRIIEIGAVKISDNKIIGKYSQLINPGQKLYKKTIELTGIDNEMVENMPTYHNVLPKFYEMIKNEVLIIHNKKFDWDRFLKPYFMKLGIMPQNKIIDTLELSKKIYPNESKHNLDIICQRLNIKNVNHHRALADAITTAGIFLKFKENLKSDLELNNLEKKDDKFKQIDLLQEEKDKNEKSKNIQAENKIIIKGIRKWNSSDKKVKRIYVIMNIGTVFFDTNTRVWENKDVKQEINFKEIQNRVIKYMKDRPNLKKCCN